MRIKIASRKSDLARLQAYTVAEALLKVNANLQIDFQFKSSLGDQNLDDPLWTMGSKGVFTEDFYQDLVSGSTDMVVHSWKDLPVQEREETVIAATLPREDARDIFLFKKSSWERVKRERRLRIYSSSPRRAYNLQDFLPQAFPASLEQIDFESVRGNIPTRFRKLMENPNIDGLVMAKAALDRLLKSCQEEFGETRQRLRHWLSDCWWMVLPLSKNPSAAAQGALAIEVAKNRKDLLQLLERVQCQETFDQAERERAILASYGGGCHQKIGVTVITRAMGQITFYRGLTDAGQVLDSVEVQQAQNEFPRTSKDNVWPLQLGDETQWFDRQPLNGPPIKLQIEDRQKALWISRAEALPEDYSPDFDQLVWTAGVKSWQRLAQRGVWVSGCAESLGEREDERLQALLGRSPQWLKLTHTEGFGAEQGAMLATYKLIPRPVTPDLRGKTHFFWTSASAFLRALQLYPEIKSGYHASGPGHTFEVLSRHLQDQHRKQVFLSHGQWLNSILTENL